MHAKERGEVNREFFDTISPIYDKKTAADWKSPSTVAAIAKPSIGAETKLLDFGVGTGNLLSALGVNKMQSNVFAVDVSSGMVDVCREKFLAADVRQITTPDDISTFDWPPFDLIVSSGVFEYIERIDSLIRTLKELLSHVGELIFTYQPIIMHHPKQGDRTTETFWTVDFAGSVGLNIARDIESVQFRWHAKEVYDFCRTADLDIIQHESFVAFYDGPDTKSSPRIYNIVRAKSISI